MLRKHLFLNDVLIKSINLVGRTKAKGGTLVYGVNLNVKDGSSSNSITSLSTSLLNKKTERSSLESQSQFGRRGRRSGVGEDTLVLCELLVYIRDKSSRVTKSVLVSHVVVNQLLVSRNVLGSTQVRRSEDLAVLGNLDTSTGANPRFPGSIGELTSLRGTSVSELISSIIKCNKNGGTRSVKCNKRGLLVASSGTNESSFLTPDSNHGSNSPVVINNGGSIKGIPAYSVFSFSTFVSVTDLWVLFTGTLTDYRGVLACLPHEVISDNIYTQLGISEGVGTSLNGYKSSTKGLGNVSTGVKHVLDHSLKLIVSALLIQDIIQRGITVLLLSGSVETGATSTILSISTKKLGLSTRGEGGRRKGRNGGNEKGGNGKLHLSDIGMLLTLYVV
mmetsp:Transcript_18777/g.24382  ORF Transcript_18777/g.24382 Transcript_18777/m.24382 type:complete len:390 (-) Transcript_18777:51-1220(-)